MFDSLIQNPPNDIYLGGIALGTGPSFSDFLKEPVIVYSKEEDVPDESVPEKWSKQIVEWSPRLYGCGVVSMYINNLSAYCYGDVTHLGRVPDPEGQFHPGCRNFASTRNMVDQPDWAVSKCIQNVFEPFAALDLPHGDSSGGMTLSLACLEYDIVGIVGFDGHREGFKGISDEDYRDFINKFRYLINYWQNRGRRIVSLMTDSVFNNILEPAVGSGPRLAPKQ